MKLHVRKNDTVVVVSGKDKGKEGVVLSAQPSNNKVVVEGVNVVKKHVRPSQMNPDGGIVEFEAPIHVSNVMIVDPKSGKPSRVGFKFVDGKKVRFAKKSGEVL